MFYSITAGLLQNLLSPSTAEFILPIAIHGKTFTVNSNGKVLIQYRFETKKLMVSEEW